MATGLTGSSVADSLRPCHSRACIDNNFLVSYIFPMNEADTTQEILTIIQFLKDNMVSKEDLESRLSGLATQESLKKLSDDITQALDDQLVILQRLDQERLFTIAS